MAVARGSEPRPGRPGFGALWVILLAAGEGKRLQEFTCDRTGAPVPKQFWSADGDRSMVRWAVDRATRLVPARRLVPIVASQHRGWWAVDLDDVPAGNIVVQPQNKGTAVGLLLPLLRILRRDPLARVVVLPSDHYVADEARLREAIVEAAAAVERRRDRVVLLGMQPRAADVEYGWILPAAGGDALRPVAEFLEKPAREQARRLMERGAVLNSLILVATGAALLQLYREALPRLSVDFAAWLERDDDSWDSLSRLYHDTPSHDFSREVLERSVQRLHVLSVADCGWSDLGTPVRLLTFVKQAAPRRAGTIGRYTAAT